MEAGFRRPLLNNLAVLPLCNRMKLSSQVIYRPEYQGLSCGKRYLHDLRDLLRGVTFELKQEERHALISRKRCHGILHEPRFFPLLESFLDSGARVRNGFVKLYSM